MTALPRIMVGAPVRDRAWVLPRYLAALADLDYPRDRLQFCFVVNDCTDGSAALLQAWQPGAPVRILRRDFGAAASVRAERGWYRFAHLAQLRNLLLAAFLASGAAWLFSVDTDILLPPDAVRQLLAAGKPLVAGVIRNDLHFQGPADHPYYNWLMRAGPQLTHGRELPADEVFPVDVTGAVVLIHRDVVTAGVRYAPAETGEDEGFCAAARAAGFSVWCHAGVRAEHVMVRPDLPPSEGG